MAGDPRLPFQVKSLSPRAIAQWRARVPRHQEQRFGGRHGRRFTPVSTPTTPEAAS
jgi:hypothetical protein